MHGGDGDRDERETRQLQATGYRLQRETLSLQIPLYHLSSLRPALQPTHLFWFTFII